MCPMSVDRTRGSYKSSRASRVLAEVGNTNSDLSRTCTNCASMDKMVFKHGPCVNNKTESAIHINEEPFTSFYTVEKEIGRGKFAVVKKCQHKATGIDYAAKYLRKRRKGKDSRAEILREIEMLKVALVHPRLVDLVEVYETSHDIILVTEYAEGGELFNHVIMEEGFKERDVIRLMKQVLEGLVFLHNQNIVHLDVKPSNILLTDTSLSGNIKLCDFGFARRLTAGEDFRDIIGTPDYVAPEVLSYESINMASDMWSVGVLAYVMLTGHSPFAGDNNQETFLNISQVNLEFPDDLFADVSEEAQDFITQLLVREPRQRLTAVQCLQHQWLKEDGIEAPSPQTSAVALPTKSPFGSPVGHRRARTPPSPETSPGVGPLKKCKSDEDYNETCTKTDNDLDANEPADVEVIAVSEMEFNATALPHRTDCRSSSVPNSPFVTKKETCVASVNSVPASPVVLKRLYNPRDNMSDLWGKLEETAASVCV